MNPNVLLPDLRVLPSITTSDPDENSVNCCLKSKGMFSCLDNPERNVVGRCTEFMAQRCSSKWDKSCEDYLNKMDNQDFTGKHSREFLKQALETQFCHINSDKPGSKCSILPEKFNPLKKDTPIFTKQFGNLLYRKDPKLYDLKMDYNALAKLTTAEPLKILPCPKICNNFNSNNLTNNNQLLNHALDRGAGIDVLQNIAENIVSSGMNVTNDKLNDYINKYVINPINTSKSQYQPGWSSMGSNTPQLISKQVAMPSVIPSVLKNNIYEVASKNDMSKFDGIHTRKSAPELLSISPPIEKFRYRQNNNNNNNNMKNIIIIAIVIVLIYLILKK